jgi:hypothetical protein
MGPAHRAFDGFDNTGLFQTIRMVVTKNTRSAKGVSAVGPHGEPEFVAKTDGTTTRHRDSILRFVYFQHIAGGGLGHRPLHANPYGFLQSNHV